MNLKKILLVGICLTCCVFATNTWAVSTKIGVMDVQKIITGCKAGPAAQAQFDAKLKAFEKDFKKQEEGLIALKKEIEKKQSVWSKEKANEKMKEYQKIGQNLQAKRANSQMIVRRMQDEEIKPILKELEDVVEKFGKKNKYTAIFEAKGGVVYFDDSIIVTDKLIKELDKAMAE